VETNGLLQADSLNPLLFNTATADAVKDIRNQDRQSQSTCKPKAW